MKVITANKKEHNTLIRNLRNHFAYDFSLFLNMLFPANGFYGDSKNSEAGLSPLKYYWDYPEDYSMHLAYFEDKENIWDGQLIGYCGIIKGESKFFPGKDENYIHEFWITPAFRGTGYSLEFFSEIEKMYKGFWSLFVMKQNKRAIKFWNKATKELPNFKRIRYNNTPEGEDHEYDGWLYTWDTG